jgi:hypothetical protein
MVFTLADGILGFVELFFGEPLSCSGGRGQGGGGGRRSPGVPLVWPGPALFTAAWLLSRAGGRAEHSSEQVGGPLCPQGVCTWMARVGRQAGWRVGMGVGLRGEEVVGAAWEWVWPGNGAALPAPRRREPPGRVLVPLSCRLGAGLRAHGPGLIGEWRQGLGPLRAEAVNLGCRVAGAAASAGCCGAIRRPQRAPCAPPAALVARLPAALMSCAAAAGAWRRARARCRAAPCGGATRRQRRTAAAPPPSGGAPPPAARAGARAAP